VDSAGTDTVTIGPTASKNTAVTVIENARRMAAIVAVNFLCEFPRLSNKALRLSEIIVASFEQRFVVYFKIRPLPERNAARSDKAQFSRDLHERCRVFDDGDDLVAGHAPEYVQRGQDAHATNSPGGLHDFAAVKARARFSRVTHPANSDGFMPGPHVIARRGEKRNALASAIHRLPPTTGRQHWASIGTTSHKIDDALIQCRTLEGNPRRRAADCGDERATPHSITSSVRAINVGRSGRVVPAQTALGRQPIASWTRVTT
jgi:hypothetical protein